MDKVNVVYIHHGLLFSHKEERNYIICGKIDGIIDHHVEQRKPSSKSQISQVFTHMWNLG
jgi:hypothetical protein